MARRRDLHLATLIPQIEKLLGAAKFGVFEVDAFLPLKEARRLRRTANASHRRPSQPGRAARR